MNNDVIDRFNNLISKYIKKDRINHAYLIETNYDNKILLSELLINKILSFDNKYSLNDLRVNGDLIVVSNDTNSIKTEEIEQIKNRFKTKSILNSIRVYVIDGAEKLNNYAANKLLKFLEEPEDNIIAILLTNNKSSVISTIISRCFNIRFFINDNFITKFDDEYWEKIFSFIMNIEENKENAIAFQNKYNIKELSDRVYFKEFLNNILYVYDDVINNIVDGQVIYFNNYSERIRKICEYNNMDTIKTKINAINICIERLKYNPNIKLLIDKLIILMSGVDVDV